MAIVKFNVADVLRSKNLEARWYSWQINRIEGPTASDDKLAVNYKFVFTLIDENPDLDGKEINRTFSSKAIGMMIPLVAAIRGVRTTEIKPEAFEVDLDELKGKKIDGMCKVEMYNGNPQNRVEEYAPYKSMKGAPTAF